MKDASTFLTCDSCGITMHTQCFLDKASLRAMALHKHQDRVFCAGCGDDAD
jgi:hypothetical protein